jgi:RNA polymerase sigma factor (sigma-70 family)
MTPLPPITALREGDEDAWTQLAAQLFPVALAAAKTKLYGEFEEDARDVANKGLHTLLAKVDDVESSEELPSLLITIVYAEAVDFLRHHHAAKRGGGRVSRFGVLEDWFEAEGFDSPLDGALPVDEAHLSSLAEIIRRLSAILPPKVRDILIDRFYWNKSAPEIAAARGMTEGAVRTALSRALADLHEHLQGHSQLFQEIRALLQIPAKVVSMLLVFL